MHDPRWCARLRAGSTGRTGSNASDRPPPAPGAETPTPTRHIVDRADFDPAYDPSAPIVCEICGGMMRYVASCKIACGVCGYRRDCSDP